MLVVWLAFALGGIALTIASSRLAVDHASAVAVGLGVPPFLIGVTLMAVGTDLPEVANSIIASLNGYGDLNVGDSIGSVATQVTLVLGLLPILGGSFVIARGRVLAPGILTLLALVLGAGLVGDGHLSRLDGAVLVTAWVASTIYLSRHLPPDEQAQLPMATRSPWHHGMVAMVGFVGVAAGASATVIGTVRVAEIVGVPIFVISFFAVSLGTSLPELVVDVVALRRGHTDIAIGDLVGASLLDATLSIGSGPLVHPTAVTTGPALRGIAVAAIGVLVVTVLFTRVRRHRPLIGLALIGLYALSYPFILSA